MTDKLKGLWVSDLVVPTGFSTVSHGILEYLSEDIDVTGVGVNYKGDPHNHKFPIFPAFLGGDIYGIKRIVDLLNQSKFDFVFILNDVWVVHNYLKAIKDHVKAELPKIFVYFPIDAEYHSSKWYSNFDIVTRAFTYTKFGKHVVQQANSKVKVDVIPHGTDLDNFYKKFEKKSDAKVHLFKNQIQAMGDPRELFIVLNANRNQPRKRLDISIEGFSMFAKDKPLTAKLYMHCGVTDASVNVVELAERFGVDDRLVLTSVVHGVQNAPIEYLNDIYNACDVGINTSMGEGWGLTNTEHAVTETAQIVPDHSACREIFEDCGLLMDTVTRFTFDNSMVVGKLVSPEEVADKLQILYDDRKLLKQLGKKAAVKLTDIEYQWNTIANRWLKEFQEGVNDDSGTMALDNSNEVGDN